MMGTRTFITFLSLLLFCLPSYAGLQTSAPPLALEVLYGPEGGPDRFLVDFRDELLRNLKVRSCFSAVGGKAEEGKLLLRVTLEAPLEETRNDLSLHGSMRNEEERGMSTTTTTIRVHAKIEILLPWTREVFRSKRIRLEQSYRPHFAGEDGSEEAREQLIRWLSSRVEGYACKADGKKLRRKLQEAEAPSPR